MMLSDQDPNVGGRNSRASNVSAMSGASGKPASRAPSADIQPLDRAVSSMLRTGTEMGNVGIGPQFDDLSNMSNAQRSMRSRATSRMSQASSMSNTSSRGSKQHVRAYPSSSAPRQPMQHHGPVYTADTLSPTMMNATESSPFNRRDNRDRDAHRSHSMTHTIQPPAYGFSSNRSNPSLRPRPASRSSNPYYVYPAGGGHKPPGSYPRPVQPALSDDSRVHLQGPQTYDGQRLPYAGQAQGYGNPVYTHHKYGQQHAGQGQGHRGLRNRQGPGQMRTRNPSSRSTMSLEGPPVEDDDFPIYRGANHPDQSMQVQNMATGQPMSRKMTGNSTREPRSEDRRERRRQDEYQPPLPAGHQQRIAAEQARLKRSAPASMSSFNTNLRTESEPPSSDMALPPTPKDGSSMEVHRNLDRNRVLKATNTNRLVIQEELSSVPYYDTSDQLGPVESADPRTDADPVGFIDRRIATVEQFRSAGAALKSTTIVDGGRVSPAKQHRIHYRELLREDFEDELERERQAQKQVRKRYCGAPSVPRSSPHHQEFDPKRSGGFNDGRYPVLNGVSDLFGAISIAPEQASISVKKAPRTKISDTTLRAKVSDTTIKAKVSDTAVADEVADITVVDTKVSDTGASAAVEDQ
ncbi:hypothetical protein J4E91_001519 [Alternaria rosae]|nr:hypothetical protein J4E91_001519 [Alternaria rosae]